MHVAYLNISDTYGKTFKPYADYMNNLGSEESRRLWSVCLDGLKLFGLTEEHVTNVASVVGIRLPVRYAKKRSYSSWTMSVGVFWVGDAAFQTHFWPGRGLNSACKEVAILALCLASKF